MSLSKELPTVAALPSGWRPTQRRRIWLETINAVAIIAVIFTVAHWYLPSIALNTTINTVASSCDQVEPRIPKAFGNVSLDVFKNKAVKRRAYEHLAGAVKVNTESFDEQRNVPSTEGPERSGFLKLHAVLEKQYPLTHAALERHVVNKYSLLFVWKGSNESAGAPLMLCSHMDTVPVLNDTKNLWTHEPWSGHIDEEGGAIWGRGSSDAKSSLIGILEAVEILLEGGYNPQRTVLLAFGHDEEISGHQGAAKLSEFIMEHLGLENKVGMIVDEGSGISELLGAELAMVSVAEKGYYDAIVTIKTPGGHSSMPPDHTSIGMLADAVVALEANPHPLSLPDNSPYLQSLVCLARYSPKIDPWLKFAIEHISEFRTAVISALSSAIDSRYLMTTSQAVDIITGGHKVNALPEVVSFLVNHRVAFDSSSTLLEARLMKILKPVAAKHNLNLTLVPADPSSPPVTVTVPSDVTAHGSMSIKPYAPALEPAPVSPSFGDAAYETLAGTIMHVLAPKGTGKVVKPEPGKEDLNFAVSPMLMPANTDTRHYWRLTRNIYRFGPYRKLGGIHTVDEYITQDSFLEGVAFFHELIRNWNDQ